jgi:transposase
MDEVTDIHSMLSFLLKKVEEQSLLIERLESENKELRDRLSRFNPPRKDSHNSNLPPSKELPSSEYIRKTKSLRMNSSRRRGGQYGHKGESLQFLSPDRIVPLVPCYCSHCHGALSCADAVLHEVRQSIDIPPVRKYVTEYRQYRKQCTCGHVTLCPFPDGVTSHAVYGSGVEQLVSYFSVYHYLPFQRLRELLGDVFDLKLSTGTIHNILKRMRLRSEKAYEKIRLLLGSSPVVGADETGTAINGRIYWSWVWQTSRISYIHVDNARGREAIRRVIPHGLPQSTLVTDCFTPYFLYAKPKSHQICIAHLLRELRYLGEYYKDQNWSARFSEMLCRGLRLAKEGCSPADWKQLIVQHHELLQEEISHVQQKLRSFQQRMIKRKECLFNFLKIPDVPPDNNASERDIRGFKVKLKIAGCFRSVEGAQAFATLQSIIKTAKKNGTSPFEVMMRVAENYTT